MYHSSRYVWNTGQMFIPLLIAAGVFTLAHRLVMTSVDTFNGYGDQGPDFRL